MILNLPRSSTRYVVPGTDTYRLASKKITLKFTTPKKEGMCGENLQNKEKSIRKIYLPDDGKIFVQVDQSGAEALIVAYLCRHANFRDLFINGIKSHVYVGLHVFTSIWQEELKNSGIVIKDLVDTPINSLTSNPQWKSVDKLIRSSDSWPAERRYYYIAKQICHASNYGMKAGMFQLNTLEKSKGRIVISKHDAEFYLSTYHGLFPEIHEWHRQVEQQLIKTKTLYNLFGYPREFWYPKDYPDDQLLKKAYAFPAQSTVGTITNIAYTNEQTFIEVTHRINTVHQIPNINLKVTEALDKFGSQKREWDLLANTHDSSLTQCFTGEERNCAAVKQFFMNQQLVAPSDGTIFNMKSEAQTGYNWSPAKESKNDNGLKDILV